jgi:hypothetical protein
VATKKTAVKAKVTKSPEPVASVKLEPVVVKPDFTVPANYRPRASTVEAYKLTAPKQVPLKHGDIIAKPGQFVVTYFQADQVTVKEIIVMEEEKFFQEFEPV